MTLQHNDPAAVVQGIVDQMKTYGISRVPVDYFHVGEYRYTNVEDAIAEAERRLGTAPPPGRRRAP